jgi:hypothetical protein
MNESYGLGVVIRDSKPTRKYFPVATSFQILIRNEKSWQYVAAPHENAPYVIELGDCLKRITLACSYMAPYKGIWTRLVSQKSSILEYSQAFCKRVVGVHYKLFIWLLAA